VTVSVFVVDRVVVVADSVVVTVFVREVAVVVDVSAAAVAVVLLVVVAGAVCDADPVFVALVICVSVFEMLLAMLEAPPEPHPATRLVTTQSPAM
jgi:hypothetical protein